jgi:hypothetical protein
MSPKQRLVQGCRILCLQFELALQLPSLLTQPFRLSANVCPAYRQINDGPAVCDGEQRIQGQEDYNALDARVEGNAEMMSHWPRDKDGTRHIDSFRHVLRDGNRDGWNSERFNLSLNQSNGLMADRSSRGEQCDVGPLLLHNRTGDVRGDGGFECLWIHVVTDETEEVLCKCTNHLLCNQFL